MRYGVQEMNKENFSEELKKLNITKKEFADMCGISYMTVNNWNDENRPIPAWVDSWIQNYKFKNFYDVVKTEFDKQKDI